MGHAEARAGRSVHLAEDHDGAIEDAASLEVAPQLVPFADAFAHACEDGDALVLGDDRVDQLHEQQRLADARAAEETRLASARERAEQIDDLDPRPHRHESRLVSMQLGRRAMNGAPLLRRERRAAVERCTRHVDDATEQLLPDGHGQRSAGRLDDRSASKTARRSERQRTNEPRGEMGLDLEHAAGLAGHAQRLADGRRGRTIELDVDDSAVHCRDRAEHAKPWCCTSRARADRAEADADAAPSARNAANAMRTSDARAARRWCATKGMQRGAAFSSTRVRRRGPRRAETALLSSSMAERGPRVRGTHRAARSRGSLEDGCRCRTKRR